MLTLLLVSVLSAANPPAVEAWANKACSVSHKGAGSNVEYKNELGDRSQCLKRAMNRALDKVIVPLKQREPEKFKAWMALQADYNRWMADACAAVEDSHWVDPSTGERSIGTAYGTREQKCLQHQYAWRGFYADAWARQDWKALSSALEAYAKTAPERQALMSQYQRQAKQAAARAPEHVEETDAPLRPLSREDWKAYNERLERAASGPQALAEKQCALVPQPRPTCVESFQASLVSQMDFSGALGLPAGK